MPAHVLLLKVSSEMLNVEADSHYSEFLQWRRGVVTIAAAESGNLQCLGGYWYPWVYVPPSSDFIQFESSVVVFG